MTIEEKLKNLMLERYGTVLDFARAHDIPNSSIVSIINRGVRKSSVSNVIKICHALEISVDGLLDDKILPAEPTEAPLQDLSKITNLAARNVKTLDGIALSPDELDEIEFALNFLVQSLRRRRGKK